MGVCVYLLRIVPNFLLKSSILTVHKRSKSVLVLLLPAKADVEYNANIVQFFEC